MAFVTAYFRHKADCKWKQDEREGRITELSARLGPVNESDRKLVSQNIEEVARDVKAGARSPVDILHSYTRVALSAQARTNCLTEIMVSDAERWLKDGSVDTKHGPLAGIPISVKDTVSVAGFDNSVGYSRNVRHPAAIDAPIVHLLKDAGAVPYVKTNIPTTLLSFESSNDVWGRCLNPHSPDFSPGGSSGGEGALLALGGPVGIGSDIAGSVRAPAHFSGVFSLRCSTGRWLRCGNSSSLYGHEGVPGVYSPMARTLADLTYFTRAVISMRPWTYDYTVHPLPWRDEVEADLCRPDRKLRIGIMRTDGVADPSPPCRRALGIVENTMRARGHTIVEIDPPSPYEGLCLAAALVVTDGCATIMSFMRPGESNDPGVAQLVRLVRLPWIFRSLYYLWTRYVRRDLVWAGLVRELRPRSSADAWKLVARREEYRQRWFSWWDSAKIDVILTTPFPLPAIPHGAMRDAISACNYTFLFNLLDYSAGVMPVTRVDQAIDQFPADFSLGKLNGVAQGVYKFYNAQTMHGLPIGVQVVGRRLEEEKVLAVMGRINEALGNQSYKPIDPSEI